MSHHNGNKPADVKMAIAVVFFPVAIILPQSSDRAQPITNPFLMLESSLWRILAISSGWFQHMVIHGNSSVLNVRDTVAGSCRAGIVSVALGFAVLCHSLHSLALSITVPLLPFSCSLFLWPPRRAGSGLPLWLSFSDGNVHQRCFSQGKDEKSTEPPRFWCRWSFVCPRRQFGW